LKALRYKRPRLKILVVSRFLNGEVPKASELVGATASPSKADAQQQLLKAVNKIARIAKGGKVQAAPKQISYHCELKSAGEWELLPISSSTSQPFWIYS